MTQLVHSTRIRIITLILLFVLAFGAGGSLALAGLDDDAESNLPGPVAEPAGPSETEPAPVVAANAEGQLLPANPAITGTVDAPRIQQFLFVAGSNFIPRSSLATFSYLGGGCLQRDSTAGDNWFTTHIQLPDGAVINGMTVYFFDSHGTYDINSELWNFDGAGGTNLLAEADSSGSPGYSSVAAPAFTHLVDNSGGPLSVVASIQGGVGSSLALCGLQIAFDYSPLATNYLPTVQHAPSS